jgi:exodeoxyribonuclease V alpha subunit
VSAGSSLGRCVVPAEVSVLLPFAEAGVFTSFEVQLATSAVRLQAGVSDEAILALAMAARAPRLGHVCAELDRVAGQFVDSEDPTGALDAMPWPSIDAWAAALADSGLVAHPDHESPELVPPLVVEGNRVYLQRYWHYERSVADDLLVRARHEGVMAGSALPEGTGAALDSVLDTLFRPGDSLQPDLQREAVRRAMTSRVSVIAGGPGTGKTHTVARILAAAQVMSAADDRRLDVGLAAPTGKAAARMGEAVEGAVLALESDGTIGPALAQVLAGTDAMTVHRLLGWLPGERFRHDRQNPLPHDLVILDETSMVSLPLMARLLDAVRPEARLVLVGDPFQLASIDAGTVLGDVVGPSERTGDPEGVAAGQSSGTLAGRVTVLRRMHRFGSDSAIAALAEAVRAGDADGALALLGDDQADVHWVGDIDGDRSDDVLDLVAKAGIESVEGALAGDAHASLAAANRIKVLTATRQGPRGLYDWSDRIESAVAEEVPQMHRIRRWYVGRPIIVTGNDRVNRVFNGDVGVVVDHDGEMRVAFAEGEDIRYLPPSRLDMVETWWAMTIHKSQGSEFPHVVVSLPQAESPVLTRQLLYTAVTRAREELTIVAGEASLRAAINRPVARSSGLRDRLWPSSSERIGGRTPHESSIPSPAPGRRI